MFSGKKGIGYASVQGMPLSPIRSIISQMVGGDKFEKITTESGAVLYAINGRNVDPALWHERALAAQQTEKENKAQQEAR